MSGLLNHKYFSGYNTAEWYCIKVSVVWLWLWLLWDVSISPAGIPFPAGFCQWIDCSMLVSANTVQVALGTGALLSVLYVAEWQMKWVTAAMFLLSLLLFTLQDSNGIFPRNGLYTTIFLVQSIAYWRNAPALKTERIQFAIQIIVAGYLLAAIAKLQQSGLQWITDAPMASLQMIKGYAYQYIDTGNPAELLNGMNRADFAWQHPHFIQGLFAASLLLELFAWLAVKNKKWALAIGLALLCMHTGIDYFMHIRIKSIYYLMLIFLLNPVYWGYAFIYFLGQKLGLLPATTNTAD